MKKFVTLFFLIVSASLANAWDFLYCGTGSPSGDWPARNSAVEAFASTATTPLSPLTTGLPFTTRTTGAASAYVAAAPKARATTPLSPLTTGLPFTNRTAAAVDGAVPPKAARRTGNNPALATHDGVTVYYSDYWGGGLGSIASGDLPVAGFVTRSSDPFAVLDRAYRVENLQVKWMRNGDSFVPYVEYADAKWICTDGTIQIPEDELPKTISKLDLLLVLRELDKTDEFMQWLELSGLKIYWDAAQVMTTDHPLFEQGFASVREALGLTEEEANELLDMIAK